ncbi:hypothetical protein CLOHYLEM_05589 [[Clostridium] hylemonae DSM 15053]|uniref:Uncharacterized protein n=1 Tax=[Clostridium] hylemonae DSM 15053 TaxID=553973 RepID=C0C0J3_9FIRM|nr:hypothetical protein CLOHYLEM_05589 [[Clostridium] hylemonae DSM 15053]
MIRSEILAALSVRSGLAAGKKKTVTPYILRNHGLCVPVTK